MAGELKLMIKIALGVCSENFKKSKTDFNDRCLPERKNAE
jgi:hypothetical protein